MKGQTISHYKILDKIGEGGMGVVYKGRDTKLDRVVALKFLPQHLTASEEDKQRFTREAKAAAALHNSTVFEDLVCEDEHSLFGDKVYDRDSLKQIARKKGWYYGILDKGKRNDPLSSTQKKRNRRQQQVRSQVEHPFAQIKDRYAQRLARAKSKVRNKARFVIASICWNIERGITWLKKQQKLTPARFT